MLVYPNPAVSFADSIGSVTPFVHWIEDYPIPDGLKMPSHIGSYDGKGDPDNFLHLFERAIHMQKWLMPGSESSPTPGGSLRKERKRSTPTILFDSIHEGHQPSTNMRGNLLPNGTLRSHHAQPFIPSSLHTHTRLVPIHVNRYSQPSTSLVNGKTPNFPFQTQIGNPPAGGISTYHPQGGIYHRLSPIMAYLHTMGLCSFADSTGSVTPFVYWIEDYPLPDGLKMPSHIGSYDGKGDPDNFLHLFEGAIRMQKWLMPVACHMFTYTLKDSARIWWNSQKTGSILNYEDLKAKFRSHFSQQKKFTKTHLAVHNIKQREGESTRAFITRYTDDTLQILGLHEEQRISGFVHGLRTRSLVEHLSTYLPSTYKGLMEKTYTWIEAREVATNGTPNDQKENFKRSRKSSWDNN
ncbi:reverse transcriptase domain-containing protein [Tanacetum coccineum]